MSNEDHTTDAPSDLTHEERMTALFANLVLQQANMALMFLGKLPHPESGKEVCDLEAARLFIDNLEMIELRTKGNLQPDEQSLLKQSLMNARMAFVEVANKAPGKPTPDQPAAPPESKAPSPGAPAAEAEADARKKYVKKY